MNKTERDKARLRESELNAYSAPNAYSTTQSVAPHKAEPDPPIPSAAESFVPAPKDTVLPTIENFVLAHLDHRSVIELARGSLRFEALARATPEQFSAIFRSVYKGAKLDALVDQMVIDLHTDKMKS